MYGMVLYSIAVGAYIVSWTKDPKKTKTGWKKGIMALGNMMPTLLFIMGLIGLLLTLLPPHWIAHYLGQEGGFFGTVLAALIGSITLIPGIIAFPLAGSIYTAGASMQTVAAFITTVTMVGVLTAPMEVQLLGRGYTIWRNSLSFVFALVIALIMGVFM